MLRMYSAGHSQHTVQAIHNMTNFLCKKIHTNSHEFVRISSFLIRARNSRKIVHEFLREFAHEFVDEFMAEDYVFKEKIWGKYQYH